MKQKILRCLLLALFFHIGIRAFAQFSKEVYQYWKDGKIKDLVQLYEENPQLRSSIADALTMTDDFVYNKLTYEDLQEILLLCKGDSTLTHYFNPLLARQEYLIIKELCVMTPDIFLSYVKKYPQRKQLLYETLGANIVAQRHNLSVAELLFVQHKIPDLQPQVMANEIASRGAEMQKIIRDSIDNYMQVEQMQSDLFYYVLERKTYTYVCVKYEQVCYRYANIADVPNSTDEIEEQFMAIVRQCFNGKELQEYLQLEADAYCEHINAARKNYCRSAGVNKYLPLKLSVPEITFSFYSDREILAKIPKARTDYTENRETVSQIAGVAGFIFGGITTLIAKGVADYLVGDNLTDKIINARLQYVDEAFTSLQERAISDTEVIIEDIQKQIENNEHKFSKVIKSR